MKPRTSIALALLAGLHLCISPQVRAQGSAEAPGLRAWATLGLGATTAGAAGSLVVSKAIQGNRLISVAASESVEFEIVGLIGGTAPVEDTWDVGLLYGAVSHGQRGFMSASTGLALVGGTRRGRLIEGAPAGCLFFCLSVYESVNKVTIGVPVQVQAFWAPLRYVGFGVQAFGNLNTWTPFGGATVHVLVGRVR